MPELASLKIPDGLYQPARTKRGQPRNADPTLPTPGVTACHPNSSGVSPPRASSSHITLDPFRPYTSPMASTSQAIPTAPHTPPQYARYRVHGVRSVTPDSNPHPALYRRAVTPSGDGRSGDRIGPDQRREQLPHLEQLQDDRGRMHEASSSYPPPGVNEPLRVLPLPSLSRSTSYRRMPVDDKALEALQKQFMK